MDYTIIPLSERLFFIRWHRSPPSTQLHTQFLQDIQRLLNEASQPIYFLSDLRKGSIGNVATLLKLSNIAKHKNWGAGTSFSKDTATSLYTGLFARFAQRYGAPDKGYERPEEALAYLESVEPGITEGIDWESAIHES